jgi:hypothetical protein
MQILKAFWLERYTLHSAGYGIARRAWLKGIALKTGERWFGMIVTTIGIGLLLLVFYFAYQMLTHPVPGLAQALSPTSTAAGGSVNSVGKAGSSIAEFLLKLAVLFIMTFAGSHIASRGIQLYHVGGHASAGVNLLSIPVSNTGSNVRAAPNRADTGSSTDDQ